MLQQTHSREIGDYFANAKIYNAETIPQIPEALCLILPIAIVMAKQV